MKRYICKERNKDGRVRIKIVKKEGRQRVGVEHIGIGRGVKEIEMLMRLARERIRDKRQMEFKFEGGEQGLERDIRHKKSYSKYLHERISEIYEKLKFGEIKDEVFKEITIARIIEPASKAETIRILKGLGLIAPTDRMIHCSLRRAIKRGYRGEIGKKCCKFIGVEKASLLLYDVTTLYFEIDKEDEYRKSGYSKERRLDPQIIVGLLADKKGFPLAIHSFEGNKAETDTMIPVLKEFKRENKIAEITVVADAGMMSAQNLDLLELEGFKFIVGSRVAKTPYEIEEYEKNTQLIDGQVFDVQKIFSNKESKKEVIRRVVYQYRQKRAELDLRNINKQIMKAEHQLNNNAQIKKSKFLKITKTSKEIDYKMIEEAKKKAGIKGYVTNLDCDAQTVIDGYHNLFQVEKSFRMAKSDLQARPIFHQTKDSIEAHLTICFAALAIYADTYKIKQN
jgi:hypothetical protein